MIFASDAEMKGRRCFEATCDVCSGRQFFLSLVCWQLPSLNLSLDEWKLSRKEVFLQIACERRHPTIRQLAGGRFSDALHYLAGMSRHGIASVPLNTGLWVIRSSMVSELLRW
jgi:hypothetical protein